MISRTSTAKATTLVLQTVCPDYRRALFEELRRTIGSGLEVAAGDEYFSPSVRSDRSIEHLRLNNRFFLRRRICWQSGGLALGRAATVVVMEGNPRILSSWVMLILRRLLRKRSILWAHVESRSGRLGGRIRTFMFALSDHVITYSESQARLLKDSGRIRVTAAPNALYRQADMQPVTGRRLDVICVGRLVSAKKVDLLLRAFLEACPSLPDDARLHLVGEGPLRPTLETLASERGATDRVIFHGHISSHAELRALYAESLVSVSAGYVGLSATQSLGFGVSVIYANDEPHSPEIEAMTSVNSFAFIADDPTSLATQIRHAYAVRKELITRTTHISARAREHYSVELMAQRISAVVNSDHSLAS